MSITPVSPPLPPVSTSPAPASPPWAPRRAGDATTERVLAEPIAPQWNDDSVGFDSSIGIDESIGLPRRSARRRSPWLRIGILAVVALVAGTGLGLGGSWLLAKLRGDGGGDDSGQHPVPTYTGVLPSDVSTAELDPALAPDLQSVTLSGGSIRLSWTDPSGGAATFIILRTDLDEVVTVSQVDAGHTEATIAVAVLDPPATRYCFKIMAYSGRLGVSDVRCTT